MGERFEWMAFGDNVSGSQARGGKTNLISAEEDVPIFLREDAGTGRTGTSHGTAAPGSADLDARDGTPAFLLGYPAAGESPSLSGGFTSAGSPMWDGTPQQRQFASPAALGHSGGAGQVPATSSAALYADQPSAAVLQFTGDSGRVWGGLHRVRILGKGNYGCATLYSMKDDFSGGVSPTHAVVVKDINMQTMLNPSEEILAVRNELKVLRTVLGHPNLVQYVDAMFDARPPNCPVSFIMMEYCAGGDLAAVMAGCSGGSVASDEALSSPVSTPLCATTAATAAGLGHLTEPHVTSLFIQVAVALQSLHTEYGILHRDVKPHNIFLLEDGMTVRLGDFGISTQLDRVGDRAKEACGSPYYMAPELLEERAYGAAADVWSLGVVFYQLMARQLPFTATSAAELRSLVCRGRCTPLHELHNEATSCYSQQFRELVSSLLTVDAAARPTLRRVLRHKHVRECLKYVPVSVLTAKKPQPPARVSCSSAMPSSLPRPLSADGLYAGVFGADAVERAVSHAVHAGVHPIVNRVHSL